MKTDRRLLARRLREHEELGTLSQRARDQATAVLGQLDLLGELEEGRRSLAQAAAAAREVGTASAAENLSARLDAATGRLEDALDRARVQIGSSALRLRRTRYRGVLRAGELYAVPSIDEAGVESVPTFETLKEARAYRQAQRLREKTFSSRVEREVVAQANLRRDLHRAGGGGADGGGAGGDGG